MRREELYLADIVEAADAIGRFLAGVDHDEFMHDELLQSGVLQKLIVIGEAASRLPLAFRENHTGIEWSDIAAFRNIAVHVYFSVDWAIAWVSATRDAPELRRQITEILANEYPNQGSV